MATHGSEMTSFPVAGSGRARADEMLLASRTLKGGFRQVEISVPTMHCGGCMQKIE
jgi:Cu2+-exporting ATPase